ncbi:MAG TPA: hypothetical protein VJT32_11445 [bacterium]|nr:hypothetical protein [bacterium]
MNSLEQVGAILPARAADEVPRISLRANWWIAIPAAALVAAIQSRSLWFLNYVHVFGAILWTGTDIFMGFILGPILRRVDFPTRRAIITRLMPRMLFYMPTVSTVTTTAGWYMASWLGLFHLPYPQVMWLWAALVIVAVMTVQGLGFLLPINLRVYFEMCRDQPDGERIRRLMGWYIKIVASQAVLQFTIIFIMARFATGA